MNNDNKKEYTTYLVRDEELLYELASHNLLNKLCRVAPNRYVDGARVWFFDKDPSVDDVIRQYIADKHNKTKSDKRKESDKS